MIILKILLLVYIVSILFVLFIIIKEAITGEGKYKKGFIFCLILFSPYWTIYGISALLKEKSLRHKIKNLNEEEKTNEKQKLD